MKKFFVHLSVLKNRFADKFFSHIPPDRGVLCGWSKMIVVAICNFAKAALQLYAKRYCQ